MAKKKVSEPAPVEDTPSVPAIVLISQSGTQAFGSRGDLPADAVFSGGAAHDLEVSIGGAQYVLQERGETMRYRQVR